MINFQVFYLSNILGKNTLTTKRSVFVKGETDLSFLLQQVDFKLHESYAQPVRHVTAPPFEVHESGWGEFEIQIKLHFRDEMNEKPVSLVQHLQLYNTPQTPESIPVPVRSAFYDELVFTDPFTWLHAILMSGKTLKQTPLPPPATDPAPEVARLQAAVTVVAEQMDKHKMLLDERMAELVLTYISSPP